MKLMHFQAILCAVFLVAIQPGASAIKAPAAAETKSRGLEVLGNALAEARAANLPAEELRELEDALEMERRRVGLAPALAELSVEQSLRGPIVVQPKSWSHRPARPARARAESIDKADVKTAERHVEGKSTEKKEGAGDYKGHPEAVPLFDTFLFVYWGVVAVGAAAIAWPVARKHDRIMKAVDDKGNPKEEEIEELSENIWSLNIVAAVGKATYHSDGSHVSSTHVILVSLFMACLQIGAVLLMALAINPLAQPVTKEPGSPWLKGENGDEVNLMKWLMVVFLTVGQIGEVKQCRQIATAAVKMHPERLDATGTWHSVPFAAAILQYIVSNMVIWAGVATVLSFQTAPDIIYSSMSVFFITGADEMFYDFCSSVFDIEADFGCLNDFGWAEPGDPQSVSEIEEQQRNLALALKYQEKERSPLPTCYWITFKLLQVFPLFFGFFLISRAWHTGIMPTNRVHLT